VVGGPRPKTGLFLGGSSSITPGTNRENIKTMLEGLKYYRETGGNSRGQREKSWQGKSGLRGRRGTRPDFHQRRGACRHGTGGDLRPLEGKAGPGRKRAKCAGYTDYDEFLNHKMDAVIVANYFHEHTPFAIQALQAGKHVMSECTASKTLASAWRWRGPWRKAKKSTCWRRIIRSPRSTWKWRALPEKSHWRNSLRRGEYNHPMSADELLRISPGWNHWRLWMPATYYCTHALAPLMAITGGMPKSVNSLAFPTKSSARKWCASAIPARRSSSKMTTARSSGCSGFSRRSFHLVPVARHARQHGECAQSRLLGQRPGADRA